MVPKIQYTVSCLEPRTHRIGVKLPDESGKPLRFDKADETTWSGSPGAARAVTARHKVFAPDAGVHGGGPRRARRLPGRSAGALEKAMCRDRAAAVRDPLDRPQRGFDYRPMEKIL